ncbi:MAG: TetR/AcrR family transcriptional regulator [Pseudomonadota bacterium]
MRNEPSREGSREKVKAILCATERLLDDHAIDDITTSMIAREAGVTRTSLYHFFPSKVDVLEAMTDAYQDDLNERVIAFFEIGRRDDYRAAWTGVASVYRDYFNTNPVAAKLLLGNAESKQVLLDKSQDKIAMQIADMMQAKTNLPQNPGSEARAPFMFQIMTKLMMSIFSLGMRRDGKITKAIDEESNVATMAYLDSNLGERD